MTLRLYDSESRSARPFEPREAGKVGMYVCGATVQSGPHVGHLRTALTFDILRRWFERSGYEVTHVQNVTDIDDKILAKSAEHNVPWWAWAQRYEREFAAAHRALGILPPTYEPRATGHVPEMIALIERLIERGHAYTGSRGNVYFAVASWPEYGRLTRQGLDEVTQGEDFVSDKRDQHDFAMWKAPKAGEPESAVWDTPWGAGRPGWHTECSAMARRYLGETFDIHGGGLDLRFPHHENERAQSTAAGWGFVRYWMHSAWVTQSGEKMSKSLGNSLSVSEVLARHEPQVVRLALVSAHYRTMMEFTDVTVAEAKANWERFAGFIERATELVGETPDPATAELPGEFIQAMDDDLGTPAAFAAIHDHVRRGNIAVADEDLETVRTTLTAVRVMLFVLGLDPAEWAESSSSASATESALDTLVQALLADRVAARAARDWSRADAIRDQLTAAGIVVEDGVDGARWHVKGS